jgi:hypothetical protein
MALAIGYSDRAVRQFHWQEIDDDDASTVLGGKIVQVERWQLAGQVSVIESYCPGHGCSKEILYRSSTG